MAVVTWLSSLFKTVVLQEQQRGEKMTGEKKNMFLEFAWAWLALAGRKAIPRLLARFRDFYAQSTHHGARPGPTLAPWSAHGPPACPAAESARKDPRPEGKKLLRKQNSISYT